MPKLKPGTILPTPDEDARITKAAHQDQDSVPYTDEEWKAVRPTRDFAGRPISTLVKKPAKVPRRS